MIRLGRRAGVSTIAAFAMPALIGMGAFAVDLGAIHMRTRQLQGIADAAALAAANDPARAQALAEGVVAASGWPDPVNVAIETGQYRPDHAVADRFAASPMPDAVRVTLNADTPVFLGVALINGGRVEIGRRATAARSRMAAFSVGSRLASLNGGIANAILSALTGSSVSLSVMDHQALLAADVELFAFVDALRTRLSLAGVSHADVLASDLDTVDMLEAIATVLDGDGDPGSASAVRTLAGQIVAADLPLDRLIDLGPLGAGDVAPAGFGARVKAAALIDAALGLATGGRQVAIDLGAAVPGIAATRAWVAIGDRPPNSPWIAVSASGAPVLRTAQTRIYLESEIAVAGLAGIARVRLPMLVEIAQAEARLKAIDCAAGATRSATIEAKPSPGTLSITEVDRARLADHGSAIATGPAEIVRLPLIRIHGSARAELGGASGWQSLRFTQDEVDAGAVKSVATHDVARSVAASLVSGINLQVQLLGLAPINTGVITGIIGSALVPAAPALDGLIGQLTSLAGVRIGEADVRVTGLRCGQPVLVA